MSYSRQFGGADWLPTPIRVANRRDQEGPRATRDRTAANSNRVSTFAHQALSAPRRTRVHTLSTLACGGQPRMITRSSSRRIGSLFAPQAAVRT